MPNSELELIHRHLATPSSEVIRAVCMHHTNIGPQLGGVTITVIAMMMRSLCSLLIQGIADREARSISQV